MNYYKTGTKSLFSQKIEFKLQLKFLSSLNLGNNGISEK